jgi:Ser/Thr protein kinase RdoA (MazF antagonist)
MIDVTPVLQAYGSLDDGQGLVLATTLAVEPLSGGLINHTLAVGRSYVLQRLHPIFRAEVNLDIAALVPALKAGDVPVPQIVPARDGLPYVSIAPGEPAAGVWRMLTRLPGHTLHKLQSPAQARAAGAMVGRFHTALLGSDHGFHFTRPGAHDTDLHLRRLEQAVADHSQHPLCPEVSVIALELADRWRAWGAVPTLPERIIHGDLKVSNLLWNGEGAQATEVCGVIDLDTMARSTLDIELGDALRSWCNTGTEDAADPALDKGIFAAAVQGYLSTAGAWMTQAERQALAPATERICLELAMRFAGDALREDYFGWDPQRFPSRGVHNLVRARNQLGLARSVRGQMAELVQLTELG